MLAHQIFSIDKEIRANYWEKITREFTIKELERLIISSNNNSEYLWDYKYLYNHPQFDGINYLEEFPVYISWKEFSSSSSANLLFEFNRDIYGKKAWVRKVVSKLFNNKLYKWDYANLTRLPNIDSNHEIYTITPEKWDWDYISEFGTCFRAGKAFEDNFLMHKEYIEFGLFSKRTDSGISESFIKENIEYPWDWSCIVNNESIEFSFNFIFLHKDKPWNWKSLSNRQDLSWSIIKKNLEIDWDWSILSKNVSLKFTGQILVDFFEKPLDWLEISKRKEIDFNEEIITKLLDQPFDWSLLSNNKSLIQDEAVLTAIKSKWNVLDWSALSQNLLDDQLSIQFLNRYKFFLDWSIVNEKLASNIKEKHLEFFWDVLDWNNVSKSQYIDFNSEIIDKYRRNWDWVELCENPKVSESNLLNDKYKSELNYVHFLGQFNRRPFIYHFTHLFNALDIIKERKILSRNKAHGKFADAAGNLVERRGTAHNYARFYFRPKTPTQFYNECLGWDNSLTTKWGKSYYSYARMLGLPKCPIPVFFKFDLKEVLMKMHEKCYYSTGNMQTNWARVEKVSEHPLLINTEYLYSTIEDGIDIYKEYSQQEFLIDEEFDFSALDSFEIICYNEEYSNILKAHLENDPIINKINADSWNVYHRDNRELIISQTESEISIESKYRDNAYFSIKGEGIKELQILETESVKMETEAEIIAYPKVKFVLTEKPIEIHFIDTSIGKRGWLIYKN